MATTKPGTTSTPAYVPYTTFITALDSLKRDGIPGTGKIDKSLWDTHAGAIQGQLLIALRFLGLIDENNRVLPPLPLLVNASPEGRKPILRGLVENSYSALLAMDLNTISQGQLDQALREYGVNGSTLVRAARFFVKVCQETGIPISNRVTAKTSTSAGSPVARKRPAKNGSRRPSEQPPMPPVQATGKGAWEEKLLDKFPTFDPSWPDELKAQWFEGFGRLMKAKGE